MSFENAHSLFVLFLNPGRRIQSSQSGVTVAFRVTRLDPLAVPVVSSHVDQPLKCAKHVMSRSKTSHEHYRSAMEHNISVSKAKSSRISRIASRAKAAEDKVMAM